MSGRIPKRVARLQAWIRPALRWGWPAGLAAALTLTALGGALWLPPRQQALEQQRQQLATRRAALPARAASAMPAPDSGAALVARLPPDSQRQARTAALLSLATEQGLPWPRSDFRYQTDRELGLAQYRVALQVTGSYAAIRSYVAESLRRDPALALETLRLRQAPGTPGQVQAELSWVLHMQGAR